MVWGDYLAFLGVALLLLAPVLASERMSRLAGRLRRRAKRNPPGRVEIGEPARWPPDDARPPGES